MDKWTNRYTIAKEKSVGRGTLLYSQHCRNVE